MDREQMGNKYGNNNKIIIRDNIFNVDCWNFCFYIQIENPLYYID